MSSLYKAVLSIIISCALNAAVADTQKPNILIAIDDPGPELNSYGSDIGVTPSLDTLARSGVIFTNAHARLVNKSLI